MFAIAPTDSTWFESLKVSELNSFVNFWTPTPWNIKQLKIGDRLYFMLKSPIRKIGGFGEFVEYENLTGEEAWNKFGFRNGRLSKEEFVKSIQKYIHKNSSKHRNNEIDINKYTIGCIVLMNCEFWDKEHYRKADDYKIKFGKQVVTRKYFKVFDPFINIQKVTNKFNLINDPRKKIQREVNVREGQSIFKGDILKAYNNRCCISNEDIPELLEAAHIQEYRNPDSHHVQNGLLLRVDIHRLYDNGLIFIDRNFTIHVSNLVSTPFYRQYHGKSIMLPDSTSEHPSIEALELRRKEFRNIHRK